jgi:hypothetical protein
VHLREIRLEYSDFVVDILQNRLDTRITEMKSADCPRFRRLTLCPCRVLYP